MKSYLDLLGIKLYKEGDTIPDDCKSAIRVIGIYGSDDIKQRVRDYYAFESPETELKEASDNRLYSMVFAIYERAQHEVIRDT